MDNIRYVPTQIKFQNSFNRCVGFSAYLKNVACNIIIYHHKKTAAMHFQINGDHTRIRNAGISIKLYRDVRKSKFTNIFFVTENVKEDLYDFQNKFGGLKKLYQSQVFHFTKEKYDLRAGNSNEVAKNYLLVMGWKIFDCEDDLLYYFIQRKSFNSTTKLNVLRTVGIQIATQRGLEVLDRFDQDMNDSIEKVDGVPSFLMDLDEPSSNKTHNSDGRTIGQDDASINMIDGDEEEDGGGGEDTSIIGGGYSSSSSSTITLEEERDTEGKDLVLLNCNDYEDSTTTTKVIEEKTKRKYWKFPSSREVSRVATVSSSDSGSGSVDEDDLDYLFQIAKKKAIENQ